MLYLCFFMVLRRNTTSKLCLINPGVCVEGGGGGGGGGGVQRILLSRLFFVHVIVNTDQNKQML